MTVHGLNPRVMLSVLLVLYLHASLLIILMIERIENKIWIAFGVHGALFTEVFVDYLAGKSESGFIGAPFLQVGKSRSCQSDVKCISVHYTQARIERIRLD